jgi:hypothetical protein
MPDQGNSIDLAGLPIYLAAKLVADNGFYTAHAFAFASEDLVQSSTDQTIHPLRFEGE